MKRNQKNKMKTITQVMCQEHERINSLLEESKKLTDNLEKSKKIFNQFKWNLEKHLFVEEKVIFELCSSDCTGVISDIFDLMREHGEITRMIKDIEKNFSQNLKSGFSNIRKTLDEHIIFEENKFYPLLDKKLSSQTKQEIFERAGEIR